MPPPCGTMTLVTVLERGASRASARHRPISSSVFKPREPGKSVIIAWTARLGLAATQWNALRVKNIPIDALLIMLAVVLQLLAGRVSLRPLRAITNWVWVCSITLVLIIASHVVFPVSASYLNGRYVELAHGFNFQTVVPYSDNSQLIRLVLAWLVIPLAVWIWISNRVLTARQVLNWWMFGGVVSGFVAVLDNFGVLPATRIILGYVPLDGRELGLTLQPNHLGVACALALPVAFACVQRLTSRTRWLGVGAVIMLVAGVLLSGSRAGAVGVGVAIIFWTIQRRSWSAFVILVLGVGIIGVVLELGAKAAGITAIPTVSRFFGDASTIQSNLARQGLRTQAVTDFLSRPFDGVGFAQIESAHVAYLQLFAAGGILLFLLAVVALLGGFEIVLASFRAGPFGDPTFRAAGASVAVYLSLAIASNQLIERYLFLPLAVGYFLLRARPAPAKNPRRVHASRMRSTSRVRHGARAET